MMTNHKLEVNSTELREDRQTWIRLNSSTTVPDWAILFEITKDEPEYVYIGMGREELYREDRFPYGHVLIPLEAMEDVAYFILARIKDLRGE